MTSARARGGGTRRPATPEGLANPARRQVSARARARARDVVIMRRMEHILCSETSIMLSRRHLPSSSSAALSFHTEPPAKGGGVDPRAQGGFCAHTSFFCSRITRPMKRNMKIARLIGSTMRNGTDRRYAHSRTQRPLIRAEIEEASSQFGRRGDGGKKRAARAAAARVQPERAREARRHMRQQACRRQLLPTTPPANSEQPGRSPPPNDRGCRARQQYHGRPVNYKVYIV